MEDCAWVMSICTCMDGTIMRDGRQLLGTRPSANDSIHPWTPHPVPKIHFELIFGFLFLAKCFRKAEDSHRIVRSSYLPWQRMSISAVHSPRRDPHVLRSARSARYILQVLQAVLLRRESRVINHFGEASTALHLPTTWRFTLLFRVGESLKSTRHRKLPASFSCEDNAH